MQVVKITPRGYCHGVVKAINIARESGRTLEGPERVEPRGRHDEHLFGH